MTGLVCGTINSLSIRQRYTDRPTDRPTHPPILLEMKENQHWVRIRSAITECVQSFTSSVFRNSLPPNPTHTHTHAHANKNAHKIPSSFLLYQHGQRVTHDTAHTANLQSLIIYAVVLVPQLSRRSRSHILYKTRDIRITSCAISSARLLTYFTCKGHCVWWQLPIIMPRYWTSCEIIFPSFVHVSAQFRCLVLTPQLWLTISPYSSHIPIFPFHMEKRLSRRVNFRQ